MRRGMAEETVRQWLEATTARRRGCASCSGSRWRWRRSINRSIRRKRRNFIRVLAARVCARIPRPRRWCCPRFRSTSSTQNPRAAWLETRGSEVRVNAPATIDDRRTTGCSGVRVRDEMIDAPIVISTVPWFGFAALFDEPPAPLAAH